MGVSRALLDCSEIWTKERDGTHSLGRGDFHLFFCGTVSSTTACSRQVQVTVREKRTREERVGVENGAMHPDERGVGHPTRARGGRPGDAGGLHLTSGSPYL